MYVLCDLGTNVYVLCDLGTCVYLLCDLRTCVYVLYDIGTVSAPSKPTDVDARRNKYRRIRAKTRGEDKVGS